MLCLACTTPALGIAVHAAESAPSIIGIREGAEIVLPVAVTTTNVTVTVTAPGAGANVTQAVFELERQGALFQRLTSAPPFEVTFANLSVGKYFLTARFQSPVAESPSSDVSFDIRASVQRPINDSRSEASPIAPGGTTVTGSNVYATREPHEPMHAGTGGGQSIWWLFRSATNGVITITTAGSNFDTVLAVYTGADRDELRIVGESDDTGTNTFSQVSFKTVADTTYHLAVDGALSATGVTESGTIQLQVIHAAPPALSVNWPADGLSLLVSSPLIKTNLTVATTITDPTGLGHVEYWLSSHQGTLRSGTIPPPYQWKLDDIPCGDYVLTTLAANQLGLIATARMGFSVTSIAPEIFWDGTSPSTSGSFQFAIAGVKGVEYSLEGSTNLEAWSRLIRWTNFTGIQRVTELDASRFNKRFFRVQSP